MNPIKIETIDAVLVELGERLFFWGAEAGGEGGSFDGIEGADDCKGIGCEEGRVES